MRRKYFSISCNTFLNLFNGDVKNFKATDDTKLPLDSKIIDIRFNGWKNAFDVLVESETFEKVDEDDEIPRMDLAVSEAKY